MRFRILARGLRLLVLLRAHPAKLRRVRERLLEAAREVGVLLIAFAPLEAAVVRDREVAESVLLFLGLGFLLLLITLIFEWRRDDDG